MFGEGRRGPMSGRREDNIVFPLNNFVDGNKRDLMVFYP
jgi:hypothetical protein